VRALAKRYGVSPTTIQKWRKRSTTADAPMGPKEPRSTVLTAEEEAMIVAFRQHTLLPLDDCLYGLQPTIPHLTRSSPHRCLERHGISRLPEMEGDRPKTKRFADYAIGYVHIDIAEVRTEEGKLYLFVAIDRTSKLAFAKLEREANRYIASDLRALVEAVPYDIHTVLTDNGQQFCHAPRNRSGPTALYSRHMFDRVCDELGIEHRLTKPNHPWTNGQVERMNRTLKDATVKRYHYESHDQLRPPPAALPGCLQPRASPQDPQRSHALRTRPGRLDERTRTLQDQPVTSHPGTVHLACRAAPIGCTWLNQTGHSPPPRPGPRPRERSSGHGIVMGQAFAEP
jgi:transposase InsO family protein